MQRDSLNSRGLTLLETVMVLIIAGLIAGSIWVAYSKANVNDRVQRTISAIDKTINVTRDYMLTKNATLLWPIPGSGTISQDLYSAGVMPTELSFEGINTGIAPLVGMQATNVAVFKSPLGFHYFMQPGPTASTFEIRVGFPEAASAPPFSNPDECMQLIPALIGNTRVMQDRGLVGWWYGGATSITTQAGGGVAGSVPVPSFDPTVVGNNCINANDIRLYFSVRP